MVVRCYLHHAYIPLLREPLSSLHFTTKHMYWGLRHRGPRLSNYSSEWIWTGKVAKIQQHRLRKRKKTTTFMQYRILPCSVSRTGFGITAQGAVARSRGKATGKLSGFPPRASAAVKNYLSDFIGKPKVIIVPNKSFLFLVSLFSHVFVRLCGCKRTSAIAQAPRVFK